MFCSISARPPAPHEGLPGPSGAGPAVSIINLDQQLACPNRISFPDMDGKDIAHGFGRENRGGL